MVNGSDTSSVASTESEDEGPKALSVSVGLKGFQGEVNFVNCKLSYFVTFVSLGSRSRS